MAKKRIEAAAETKGASWKGRKNVAISGEAHESLKNFCGDEFDISATASDLIGWILAHGDLAFAIRSRKRAMGSDRLRFAFCGVLKSFTSEVCAGPIDRALMLDETDASEPTPASASPSRR